jgi:hypothetical protein
MISQNTVEGIIKYCLDLIEGIKGFQRVDAANAVILPSFGVGGGVGWDVTYTVPAFGYRLIRIVFTPVPASAPYAEVDVDMTVGWSFNEFRIEPDPNAATRNDRVSWVAYLRNTDSGDVNFQIKSKVRSVVPGAITYEVIL